ncbi:MAG: hypothetical protein FWG65_11980 [Turicibacter sp.]|nr:hypothetical protein [Turicibacter sp.]
MPISHTNKDILSKSLSQNYKDKSFDVYGLNVARIKQMLSTDYPVVAVEYRGDGAFLLTDNSLLLTEYESKFKFANFIKYLRYVLALLDILAKEGIKVTNVIVAVIYTGDIKTAPAVYDLGAVKVSVEQVFLSKFDTGEMYADLKAKIERGERLSDDDVMRLIILPLTQPVKKMKQGLIKDAVELAKQISDEEQMLFVLAGILTASDKFIDRKFANQLERWISMTKVGRLFEEKYEKREAAAVKAAVKEAVTTAVTEAKKATKLETAKQLAKLMLSDGEELAKIMKYTKLSRKDLQALQSQ